MAGVVAEGHLALRSAAEAAGDRPWTRAGRDGPAPSLGFGPSAGLVGALPAP